MSSLLGTASSLPTLSRPTLLSSYSGGHSFLQLLCSCSRLPPPQPQGNPIHPHSLLYFCHALVKTSVTCGHPNANVYISLDIPCKPQSQHVTTNSLTAFSAELSRFKEITSTSFLKHLVSEGVVANAEHGTCRQLQEDHNFKPSFATIESSRPVWATWNFK